MDKRISVKCKFHINPIFQYMYEVVFGESALSRFQNRMCKAGGYFIGITALISIYEKHSLMHIQDMKAEN